MDAFVSILKSVTADEFNKVVLGVVALVSLVLGPFMQWTIARKQATLQEQIAIRQSELQERIAKRQAADNISTKRQVWIDELRKDVAEYLTLFARLEELRRPASGLSPEDERLNFNEFADANKRATELGIRIKLRLNPKEDEHNEFVRLLGALATVCTDPPPNETPEQKIEAQRRFGEARDELTSIVVYEQIDGDRFQAASFC
ncbi:hypothetical protein [Trinickia diaoshuihuensis]|uniref:hypothetical protein n=1 Tax=Trinickia diaoshuihuensis TaxID=2292265 RepID=UPI0013C33C51|nr:hypothetical protein [Trinickia diaoshuihuensis]